MSARQILVIGVGGTGKSYIVNCLHPRGIPAFDADSVPGLAQFVDRNGCAVDFPRSADEQWLAQHTFQWVDLALDQLLATHPTLYLCGMADNMFDFLDRFDQVYHLRATHDLLLQRLTHPARQNWLGETAAQRRFVLRQNDMLEQQVALRGIPSVDAALSPNAIYEQIRR